MTFKMLCWQRVDYEIRAQQTVWRSDRCATAAQEFWKWLLYCHRHSFQIRNMLWISCCQLLHRAFSVLEKRGKCEASSPSALIHSSFLTLHLCFFKKKKNLYFFLFSYELQWNLQHCYWPTGTEKENIHERFMLSLSLLTGPLAALKKWSFRFQKLNEHGNAKNLHSIISPAGTAKLGCKKTKNDRL